MEPLCFALFLASCWLLVHGRSKHERRFRCCWQVEKDSFCKEVIAARVQEGHFGSTSVPIYDDVESFNLSDLEHHRVHGLTGGFPCQAREA